MFNSDLGRTVAALVCTVVLSTTCIVGAVGPAQPGAGKAAVAMAARLVA